MLLRPEAAASLIILRGGIEKHNDIESKYRNHMYIPHISHTQNTQQHGKTQRISSLKISGSLPVDAANDVRIGSRTETVEYFDSNQIAGLGYAICVASHCPGTVSACVGKRENE